MNTFLRTSLIPLTALLAACSSAPAIPTAEQVDIDRFMGDWYVIANVPRRARTMPSNRIVATRMAASPPPSPFARAPSMVPSR
jgi:lipocalin